MKKLYTILICMFIAANSHQMHSSLQTSEIKSKTRQYQEDRLKKQEDKKLKKLERDYQKWEKYEDQSENQKKGVRHYLRHMRDHEKLFSENPVEQKKDIINIENSKEYKKLIESRNKEIAEVQYNGIIGINQFLLGNHSSYKNQSKTREIEIKLKYARLIRKLVEEYNLNKIVQQYDLKIANLQAKYELEDQLSPDNLDEPANDSL